MRLAPITLIVLLASGCNFLRADAPLQLVFDESFSVEQQKRLIESAQVWNRCGAEILGYGETTPGVQTVHVAAGTPAFGNWAQYDFVPRTITIIPLLLDVEQAHPDFSSVAIAHELGHGYGLSHVEEPEAIMQNANHAGLALRAGDGAEWTRATGLPCE